MVQASMGAETANPEEQADMNQENQAQTEQNDGDQSQFQAEATVDANANGAQAGEQSETQTEATPEEPAEPQLTVREQFEKDSAEAQQAVDEAFAIVTNPDTPMEERDAAVEVYQNARKVQEALKEREAELEKLEKQESACTMINKAMGNVFKRVGIDPFMVLFDPENGASVYVPKPTRARSSSGGSSSTSGGGSGEGVSRARSTVRITVDSTEYNPSTFMKEFGDEKQDNPKGAAAWNNDRTHPMFYASAVVRLMKQGKTVVVTPGDNPSDKHKAFDQLVDTHKMRLGWGPEHEKDAILKGSSHARKAEQESGS